MTTLIISVFLMADAHDIRQLYHRAKLKIKPVTVFKMNTCGLSEGDRESYREVDGYND